MGKTAEGYYRPKKNARYYQRAEAQRLAKAIHAKPCQACSDAGRKTVKHHCDYGKPLEVMHLCRPCHAAWHKLHNPAY